MTRRAMVASRVGPAVAAAVTLAGLLAVAGPLTRRRSAQPVAAMSSTLLYNDDGVPAGANRPDIVHIVLDDIGMNDLWESGDLDGEVFPHMRALSASGVRLTNYYGQAFCTPARAALVSGKFGHRTGFGGFDVDSASTMEISAWGNFSLADAENQVFLSQRLTAAGYRSHGVGKWNLGHCNAAMLPPSRGFLSYVGYYGAGIGYVSHEVESTGTVENSFTRHFTDYTLVDMQRCTPQGCVADVGAIGEYSTTFFTNESVARVSAMSSAAPTYLYVAYHGVHDDKQANETGYALPEAVAAALAPLETRRRNFGIALHAVDRGVGEIQRALEKASDDYVLIVHSDNGGSPCGTNCDSSNAPYRGMKFFDFEGGVKLPAFAYSPTRLANRGEYGGLMHHVDWMATMLTGLAGVALECDDCDSLDHWGAITATSPDAYGVRGQIAFSVADDTATLRIQDYKYMAQRSNVTWFAEGAEVFGRANIQACMDSSYENFLFDLSADPYERNNLWFEKDYSTIRDMFETEVKRIMHDEYIPRSVPAGDPEGSADTIAAFLASSPGDDTVKHVAPWGCAMS